MPGIGDDDGNAEEAIGARGAALFNKRLAAVEDGVVEVQDPAEEEDEELDETPQAPSRKEKRGQRAASHISARERAAAAEAEAKFLREQLESPRRAPVNQPPQQRQGNPYEAIDSEIRKTFQEEKALAQRWEQTSAKASAAEIQRMEDEAAELVVRRQSLIVDRRELERAPRRAEEAKIHEQRSRFPDVFADPRAFQYAQGAYNQALARGIAPSRDLEDASFSEAREVILGVRPRPDAAQRQRASGLSAGTRPATAPVKAQINMPKGSDYDKIARAAFPKLEPAEARQKWANTVGKKLLEKQR